MTTAEVNSRGVFADARRMYESALERMAAGDIRDAAEKAWCATMRATEALVLNQPRRPPRWQEVARHCGERPVAPGPANYYLDRQGVLHGECFYHDYCDSEETGRLIRETADFIQDAERLAERKDDED